LHGDYLKNIEEDVLKNIGSFKEWARREGILGWEAFSVPEINNYKSVLSVIKKDDVVYDIGAGDFRLDLMLAEKAKRVYAVEINPIIVSKALAIIGYDIPENLVLIRGNGFSLPLPKEITLITCLMIHRQHEFPAEWDGIPRIFATHEGLSLSDGGESDIVCLRRGDP
jgi:SAM-dependent methyltransferase